MSYFGNTSCDEDDIVQDIEEQNFIDSCIRTFWLFYHPQVGVDADELDERLKNAFNSRLNRCFEGCEIINSFTIKNKTGQQYCYHGICFSINKFSLEDIIKQRSYDSEREWLSECPFVDMVEIWLFKSDSQIIFHHKRNPIINQITENAIERIYKSVWDNCKSKGKDVCLDDIQKFLEKRPGYHRGIKIRFWHAHIDSIAIPCKKLITKIEECLEHLNMLSIPVQSFSTDTPIMHMLSWVLSDTIIFWVDKKYAKEFTLLVNDDELGCYFNDAQNIVSVKLKEKHVIFRRNRQTLWGRQQKLTQNRTQTIHDF